MRIDTHRMRRLMVSSNISDGDVSEAMGVTLKVAQSWSTGDHEVPDVLVDTLADFLNATRWYLIGVGPESVRIGDITVFDIKPSEPAAENHVKREKIYFGVTDGVPMLDPGKRSIRCSCGRPVNP